jgi:molecular chaperone DnaJ
MAKDYYVVLGISRGADLSKIKSAYRKIAKQYHPDVSKKSQSSEKFREIKEAYETLIDENRRRNYDAQLEKTDSPVRITRVPETIKVRSSVFDEFDRFTSFTDEFFEGLLPGFFSSEKRARHEKDVYLEVILSPKEAQDGGLFPIKVPVFEPCPRCGKTGMWEAFFCPVCSGYGRIKAEREFSLSIPPRVSHGITVELSMEDIGLRNVILYVLVSIDPSLDQENW